MEEHYYSSNSYTWQLIKKLKEPPILLFALSGFIDAGFSSGIFISTMVRNRKTENLIHFSPDKFMNYRDRRGVAVYKNGILNSFTPLFPQIDLCFDKNNKPFLLLYGPEPDFKWLEFAKIVVSIAKKAKCTLGIGFLGMPAPVPHTRDLIVTKSATKRSLINSNTETDKGSLSIPTNISVAIEWALKCSRVPGITYNVKVPSYLAGQVYPPSGIAIANKIKEDTGLEFDLSDVNEEKDRFDNYLKNEVDDSGEFERLTKEFEEIYDKTYYEGTNVTRNSKINAENLPTGEELSKEIADYLSKQRNKKNKYDPKYF